MISASKIVRDIETGVIPAEGVARPGGPKGRKVFIPGPAAFAYTRRITRPFFRCQPRVKQSVIVQLSSVLYFTCMKNRITIVALNMATLH